MEELKKLLIQTLFHWTNACSVPKISTMPQFIFMFLFLPLVGPFFVFFSCTKGYATLRFSMNHLLLKKKGLKVLTSFLKMDW
jgi:hypothetical protein